MFNLEDCVYYITTCATKKLADAFNQRLIEFGITRVQWIALFYIGKYDGISQFELSEKMNIKSSTVVRLIDRMQNEGWVVRERDFKDRRVVKLKLAEKGAKLCKELLPEGEEFCNLITQGIAEEELAIFKKVLNNMVKNATKI